jgi:hypothetical protein
MKSEIDLSLVAGEAGTLKMERRNLARVVLPDEDGPESPISSV